MNEISAKYFSTKFIIENKLKLTDIVILEYIYSWILSDNPPEFKMESGKKAFYLSQSHIADDFSNLITQPAVSQKMKRLERCGIIETKIIDSFKGKFYVVFNWEKVLASLGSRELLEKQKYKYCSNWFEKIHQYINEEKQSENKWKEEWNKKSLHERIEYYKNEELQYQKEIESYNKSKENDMLLDDSDMNIKKPYTMQADLIAKRILTKYVQYFQNRIPTEGQKPTKTYISICHKIEDIYNGRFTSSRFYNFDEKVFKNKQFETEGWKEKIDSVKGDWNKTKKLIFKAIKNFIMMWDTQYMPLSKQYLTNNLNEWFYNDNPNQKGQSQFIQSLNEPMKTQDKLSLDKAKNIVKDIKEKDEVSYMSGHELNELLPAKASEAKAWEFIQEIINWGDLLWQFDENAKYFLQTEIDGNIESGGKVLPALFARYLSQNKISVSLSTLNIQKSAESNMPWKWFIDEACKKHDMNMDCVYCFSDADFYDAYNGSSEAFDIF